ncbi:MAG: DUF2834 domain-containing protein [Anaerolineales bacterium]|nr:DUF2834 domain-containing protein [Anaerolineales bacterium]
MKKIIYAVLCVIGIVLPYYFIFFFFQENGLDMALFVNQMFANSFARSFSMDLLVASLGLWALIYFETRQRKIRFWWVSVVANFAVGLSLALPLFLLLREFAVEAEPSVDSV